MLFSPSTVDDLEQLTEWIAYDPYHFHQGQPEWWLTGNGLLAFCLMDDRGPLTYVRLDDEGEYIRIHTQFAPESVVSKRRLVVGMLQAINTLIEVYKSTAKGLVFNSVSPGLIAFMGRLGFIAVGNDDYRLDFEVSK
jgi:hypothetical protein